MQLKHTPISKGPNLWWWMGLYKVVKMETKRCSHLVYWRFFCRHWRTSGKTCSHASDGAGWHYGKKPKSLKCETWGSDFCHSTISRCTFCLYVCRSWQRRSSAIGGIQGDHWVAAFLSRSTATVTASTIWKEATMFSAIFAPMDRLHGFHVI